MTQEAPSTTLYDKLLVLIEDIKRKYSTSTNTDPNELSILIANALNDSRLYDDRAFTEFEPIIWSEAPDSLKANRFWNNMDKDFNIIQKQVDLMKAWIIFNHNMTKTELLKNKVANEKLQNKLSTLQLYSSLSDPSIVVLGDSFLNDEFINWDDIPIDSRAAIYSDKGMGLSSETASQISVDDIAIKVLPTSNGFLGNNQELEDPEKAKTNTVTNEKMYHFKGETNYKANPSLGIDSEPTTWFEYENYLLSSKAKTLAKDLGFTFEVQIKEGEDIVKKKVNWADGPDNGVLRLNIQLALKETKNINSLSITPHNLASNSNNPIKVKKVIISENGTDWVELNPVNIWIVSAINRKLSITGDEATTIGTAHWTVNNLPVRLVRIYMEQAKPISVNVGHIYYIKKATDNDDRSVRVDGPIPLLDTAQHYSSKVEVPDSKLKKIEYFRGKRWVIGIRDINLESRTYKPTGVFVSRKFEIPGIIDRVALNADVEIPSMFDSTKSWIKFYISPDDGDNWYQISRIQDDYNDVPEIIAFNDPIPVEMRESGVKYYQVEGDVKSIKLKVEIERPSEMTALTPLVKSYELKVKRR